MGRKRTLQKGRMDRLDVKRITKISRSSKVEIHLISIRAILKKLP